VWLKLLLIIEELLLIKTR